MASKIPLAYTFGNHMHWVDMEWLWGYDVLPGSTDDMLTFCKGSGVKGGLNFDGIGYEKLASESPEHITKLREAIAEGTIEVIGASYGQPYGLFHGGESNIRQRVYGIRTCLRVLGARPRTFWEEEFDFYPQLPQILAGCGFDAASLYFQWTWHTPEIPMEDAPVVKWEGLDGSQILAATRNRLNLHQWPEDFRILLDEIAANPPLADGNQPPPLILQWLELMPTQDWMCRSELMAPMLAELQADTRFSVEPTLLGDYVRRWHGHDVPIRRYTLDQVWHGMTLGKNGDNHVKRSRQLEAVLLAEESAAAVLSLFGRPYEPWDVYPTWELEEGWRQLLAAQHHDNHECEGLCGHVAEAQFAMVETLMDQSSSRRRLGQRVGGKVSILSSPLNPTFGYQRTRIDSEQEHVESTVEACDWTIDETTARFEAATFSVEVELATGTILSLTTADGRIKNLRWSVTVAGEPLSLRCNGRMAPFQQSIKSLGFTSASPDYTCIELCPVPHSNSLEFLCHGTLCSQTPGYGGALEIHFELSQPLTHVAADHPYGMSEVGPGSAGSRKYPTGDWMTSEQWFEKVSGKFTSQSVVQIATERNDLVITHTGSQSWSRHEKSVSCTLLTIDPWDGMKSIPTFATRVGIHPGKFAPSEAIPLGREYNEYQINAQSILWGGLPVPEPNPEMPRDFRAVTVLTPGTFATAFYREQSSFAGKHLPDYALADVSHPFVLRLVEYDGLEGLVEVILAGPVARAVKTNMLGEPMTEIEVRAESDASLLSSEPEKLAAYEIAPVRLIVPMRAYEIATIYLDIIPGRKQFRDLDAKREIWATVHRTDS